MCIIQLSKARACRKRYVTLLYFQKLLKYKDVSERNNNRRSMKGDLCPGEMPYRLLGGGQLGH